jgi:hypothetical protein
MRSRTRDWRRYKEECKVINRLQRHCRGWWRYKDINNIYVRNTIWSDFIGNRLQHESKSYTTKQCDSNYKTKFSPNRSNGRYRESSGRNTRESEKIFFKKILEDAGFKHFNTECRSKLEY